MDGAAQAAREFRYRVDLRPEDFSRFMLWLMFRRNRGFRWIYSLWVLSLLAVPALVVANPKPSLKWTDFWGVGLWAAFVLGLPLLVIALGRRSFSRIPKAQRTVEYAFCHDRMEGKTELTADRLSWEVVKELYETEHGLYFSLITGGFRLIPLRKEIPLDLSGIRGLLTARLGARAHLRPQ